jgi:hypothetical protein
LRVDLCAIVKPQRCYRITSNNLADLPAPGATDNAIRPSMQSVRSTAVFNTAVFLGFRRRLRLAVAVVGAGEENDVVHANLSTLRMLSTLLP